jgi:hypothetical protein
VCILLAIKKSLEGTAGFSPTTIPAIFPGNSVTVIPLSFRDYVTSMQVKRTCEPSLLDKEWPFQISDYYDNQNPFLKCDRRRCTEENQDATLFCEYNILALAPPDISSDRGLERANALEKYVKSTYPELESNRIPIDYSFVKVFSSDAEISSYISASTYGTSGYPKIGFAVIFPDGSSEKDYAYILRQNSTNFNQPEKEGRPAQSTSPPTNKQFSYYSNLDNACAPTDGTADQGLLQYSCTGQYLYNGAIAMQRMIQDWILVNSGSEEAGMYVAEHGVQFVSFPSREFTINGFYAAIQGKFRKHMSHNCRLCVI